MEMKKNLKRRDYEGNSHGGGNNNSGGDNSGGDKSNGNVEKGAPSQNGEDAIKNMMEGGANSGFKVEKTNTSTNKNTAKDNSSTIKNHDQPNPNPQEFTNATKSTSPRHNELSARRSRLVARAAHSNASTASNTTTTKPKEPISPGKSEASSSTSYNNTKSNHRRERILAKVRANTTVKKESEDAALFKNQLSEFKNRAASPALAKKIKVTSPHAEEVEMHFADERFVLNNSSFAEKDGQEPRIEGSGIPMTRKESMDSISKEIQQPSLLMALAKKNETDGGTNTTSNGTPQKSVSSQQQRLCMASTPKIRGNGPSMMNQDSFEGVDREVEEKKEWEEEEPMMIPPSSLSERGTPKTNMTIKTQRRRSHGNNLLNTPNSHHFNPSPQSQHQYLSHPDDEKSHNIHHAYPFNERAPSTVSAISGISIPSCFPQESSFHLQQPMLGSSTTGYSNHSGSVAVGPSAIQETASLNSGSNGTRVGGSGGGSNINNLPNSSPRGNNGGISAFSSGVEHENRRLREKMGMMQKKLEEKDAIISQLMKRIADLENSRTNESNKSHRSYSVDQDSYAMSSLWDHSRPASELYTSSFHAHSPPSGDAESISMSSPPHTIAKQSPDSMAHTPSTASVTTSNSGKSHANRGNTGSRSLSGQSPASTGRMRRSRRGNAVVRSNGGGDDRRFQC